MSLNLDAVGYTTEAFEFQYDWKTVVLYALGVGAKREELDYLYEKKGPFVLPSFAVVPTYAALVPLVEKSGADFSLVVHGSQSIKLHQPIPPGGTLKTIAKIDGIYDLRRLSQVVFSTKTEMDGVLIFETEWTLIVRDTGGFGGPRPPKKPPLRIPADTPILSDTKELTSNEQALLYRLSGDLNPLHADPVFAAEVGFDQGPILHGLCTFGFITRALIAGPCAGNASRLKELSVSFKNPVWPGEELRTVTQKLEDGRIAITSYAADRESPVVAGSWAVIEAPE